jgi:hypothetical protein
MPFLREFFPCNLKMVRISYNAYKTRTNTLAYWAYSLAKKKMKCKYDTRCLSALEENVIKKI